MMRFAVRAATGARGRKVLAILGLAGISVGLLAQTAAAKPSAPTTRDQRISLLVAALLDKKHLSQMRVDDEISRRAMTMFFETLDPMKLYFLQSDVDKFAPERTKIDDEIRQGDASLANRIFDVFLARVADRTAVAQQYVDAKHDFTVDESMALDPKKLSWAASEEESNERWRKRVKYDLLLLIADADAPSKKSKKDKSKVDAPKGTPEEQEKLSYDDAKEKLHKRYKSIKQRWDQTDNDELLEMFLTAVTESFDPHSSYMSPDSLQNFVIQMQLSLDGIGASLESKYGETVVRAIVPGGAADKDGRLKVDDVITGVGQGTGGELEDITDIKLNDVVQKIRGKPGTIVRLEVKTAGGAGLQTYDVTRARIELKDSEARSKILDRGPHGEILHEESQDPDKLADAPAPAAASATPPKEATGHIIEQQNGDGKIIRIGVIELPSFYMDMEGRRNGKEDYKSTARDMRRLLEDFKQKHVDLAVIDLRFNGGGSLPESVDTTGLFIDQGPVVQVKGPEGSVQPYRDEDAGAVWSGPMMVLINKFSASASEIFAGAIQDYGRGIIVGDHSTHGKGTVQQLYELGQTINPLNPPNYGALKLTIQQFYRPGGDSTQNRGVVSDVELPSETSVFEVGESDLDYALKFDRVAPLPHDNYRNAGAQAIQELRKRSEERCAKSDFFKAEKHRIELYVQRKKDATITLNKEKFLAEKAELNTEKEQEDLIDDLQTGDRPVFPRTSYNDEVVAIALDYLELLGDSKLAQR